MLAQLSDRDELILKLVEQAGLERKEILEKLLAVASPGAVTELRREHGLRAPISPQALPRPNFPGLRRDLRPPVTPLQGKNILGGEPASDQEAVAGIQMAVDRLGKG